MGEHSSPTKCLFTEPYRHANARCYLFSQLSTCMDALNNNNKQVGLIVVGITCQRAGKRRAAVSRRPAVSTPRPAPDGNRPQLSHIYLPYGMRYISRYNTAESRQKYRFHPAFFHFLLFLAISLSVGHGCYRLRTLWMEKASIPYTSYPHPLYTHVFPPAAGRHSRLSYNTYRQRWAAIELVVWRPFNPLNTTRDNLSTSQCLYSICESSFSGSYIIYIQHMLLVFFLSLVHV